MNVVPNNSFQAPQGAIASLKRLYYDTVLSAAPFALRTLKELVDPSHLLFGSDFPFAPEIVTTQTVKGLRSFDGVGVEELIAIDRDNAARIFPGNRIAL